MFRVFSFAHAGRYLKSPACCPPVAAVLAILITLTAGAQQARAQIVYEGSGNANINAVCGFQATLIIATTDECANPTDPSAQPTAVRIGSAATGAIFQTLTGAAQFNGASSTFQNAVTMNGGITVTGGTISMGGNRVQNVGAPNAASDAATKQYVDDSNATQDTRITAVETVNATQQTQINSNTTRVTAVEGVNASQQTQINSNTTRVTAIEGVNTSQQTQINSNTARIANVETVNTSQQTQITSLQGQSTNLQDQINANTTDIVTLNANVGALQANDRALAEGIAISLALDAPMLRNGQTFAMRGGWGNFEGSNAAGFTAAGAISSNVVVDAGIGWGTSQGTVAGKAGVTIGW